MVKLLKYLLLCFANLLFLTNNNLKSQNVEDKINSLKIINPVLPGFNPDPSIVRVGNDYFIAVSTFQWFPGVTVYHSKDLKNWDLYTNILNRKSQLDLKGVPNSAGVFAPQISYKNGLYYLVYTVVIGNEWPFMDCNNFVVWANDMKGPWSDPVYINSSGFDPSLFHDNDGKSYLTYTEVDFRPGVENRTVIFLQEFDIKNFKLIGKKDQLILDKFAEGPHIYKHMGFYYLWVATGGTGYTHCEEVFRSKNIFGPYLPDPKNPILTSQHNPSLPLQKAGHCSLVQTQDSSWYVAHLASRPLMPEKKCPLGRETSIQKIVFTKDGWFRLAQGGNEPLQVVEPPNLPTVEKKIISSRDEFKNEKLSDEWLTLREPIDTSWASLTEKEGFLRIKGRNGLFNFSGQSLIAKRAVSLSYQAETSVIFNPENYRQMAGLIVYYDSHSFTYLRISADDAGRKNLNILKVKNESGWDCKELLKKPIDINSHEKIYLRVVTRNEKMQFYYSTDARNWIMAGEEMSTSDQSDEVGNGFTGTMIGICVQDVKYRTKNADFDYFELKAIE